MTTRTVEVESRTTAVEWAAGDGGEAAGYAHHFGDECGACVTLGSLCPDRHSAIPSW